MRFPLLSKTDSHPEDRTIPPARASLKVTIFRWLALFSITSLAHTAVPPFSDELTGPILDPEWTPVGPAIHPGFNEKGQYVFNGALRTNVGLQRMMGGAGSFLAEISLELSRFFLRGSGGSQSDLKIRFLGGSAGLVEIVLNSFRSLRVYSSQKGENLAPPTTLRTLSDHDRIDFKVGFIASNGSLVVHYAINGGPWIEVASTGGLKGFLDGQSDLVVFKFNPTPKTLPQIRLDRYEIRENPLAKQIPSARPDHYQVPQNTPLQIPAPGVLGNDLHPLSLALSAVLENDAALGHVRLHTDGSFRYEPPEDYAGIDEFTYRSSDGLLQSDPAKVTVKVQGPPLQIIDFDPAQEQQDTYRISWNSEPDKTYSIEGTRDWRQAWNEVATHIAGTPPTNTQLVKRPPQPFESFRVIEEAEPLPWPHTDYCALMAQEVMGKKPGFLAGNLVYYIGGEHGWNRSQGETLGLTHPFFHDLRSRGHGMVTNEATGYGHDLGGWEFWKETRVAYGTVLINGKEFVNPSPLRMYWRPDRMICEYAVDGIAIYEEKFISTDDVACSIIRSSSPIQIRFEGHSFVRDSHSIKKTATLRFDTPANTIHIVEGGTARVTPESGVTQEGTLMYDGMSTVVSANQPLAPGYQGARDRTGRQRYSFTVPTDPSGVAVAWAMDDVYAKARDRVQSLLREPERRLAEKKAHMNELLNHQIPYFRCSDPSVVDIYYYLWALHLMYYIDVGVGWEKYSHTQTAVNNFLGMHRYDAAFQIRLGAWMTDKADYAYGNALIWSALLPFAKSHGRLPDNMGTTWHSGIYGATTDHVNGAWEIYRRSGDAEFLSDCYAPYYRPLFWNGILEHWGYLYNTASNLSKMAEVLGYTEDVSHWFKLVNMDQIDQWLRSRWETDTPNWFLSGKPMNWGRMAYMGMEQFPPEWARKMTEHWAVNATDGFFTEIPLSTRALKDWSGVSPEFTVTPDTCWWAIRGMYQHHVGTLANQCTLGHLKGYHLEWDIPVAPEARDIHFAPWGDQYSNFNAGKLLLILEGIVGVDYSVPEGTFTVADHMPEDWSFLEIKLPVTQPGRTDWVDVRIDRKKGGEGRIEKTVSVVGNPLPTLAIQPWLEEKPLLTAPPDHTVSPPNHIAYRFIHATNQTVRIAFQGERSDLGD